MKQELDELFQGDVDPEVFLNTLENAASLNDALAEKGKFVMKEVFSFYFPFCFILTF
jgi:hypothetical protein